MHGELKVNVLQLVFASYKLFFSFIVVVEKTKNMTKHWSKLVAVIVLVVLLVLAIHLWNSDKGVYTVKDMDGVAYQMSGQENTANDKVSAPLLVGKLWEEYMHPLFKKYASTTQPGIVLDIGANIGVHTVFLGRFKETWSFEPQHKTFKILEGNAKRNNKGNTIRCFNFGLSDTETSVVMDVPDKNNVGATSIKKDQTTITGQNEKISLRRFDDLWTENGKPRVLMIKIDIEGHEVQAFKGAKEMITRDLPVILFEDNDGMNGPAVTYMKTLGYTVTEVRPGEGHDYLAEWK